jgi:citrate synthase
MKVKVGNTITNLPKNIIASHMANLLTTRAIMTNKEKNFKKSLIKHKELCLAFLRENKKFVYSFSDQKWLDEFLKFQSKQHELLMQELTFKFSDGSEWSLSLNDIASLKMIIAPDPKQDKNSLLSNPVELADWAQNSLTWEQVKDFSILRKIKGDQITYTNEWPLVKKQVVQFNYETED